MSITPESRALFERSYKYGAGFDGDATATKDAAAAKRLATLLKTLDTYRFEPLLGPEQLLSLKAAAATVARLAAALDGVSALARQHRRSVVAERERIENARLDAAASERWSSDSALLVSEAQDLARFMDAHGKWREDIDRWLTARRGVARVGRRLAQEHLRDVPANRRNTRMVGASGA
jgi:hypothetical protein